MSQNLLIFIFASVIQVTVFVFTLLLMRKGTQKPSKISVTGYSESAAIKIAELEGSINSLKLQFNEVIDRVEKWTKRDGQRSARADKKAELVLPTDLPTVPEAPTPGPMPGGSGNHDEFARLRAQRGY